MVWCDVYALSRALRAPVVRTVRTAGEEALRWLVMQAALSRSAEAVVRAAVSELSVESPDDPFNFEGLNAAAR